jgi:hypothetical protein
VLSQEETSQPGRKFGSVSGGGIRRKREGGAGESSLMLAKRVLVVEDDALVSMAVEAEIAGCDHAVVGPFGSGADALASLGFVEPPDAAVIDLRLRDGSCLDCARAPPVRCSLPGLHGLPRPGGVARRSSSRALDREAGPDRTARRGRQRSAACARDSGLIASVAEKQPPHAARRPGLKRYR